MKKQTVKHALSLTPGPRNDPGPDRLRRRNRLSALGRPFQGSASTESGSGEGYQIAVVRQLDHASMNEIRDAITAELDAKADELGITIAYKDFNGNNDPSTLSQIGAQIIATATTPSSPSAPPPPSRWSPPPRRARPPSSTAPSAIRRRRA